MWLLVPCCCKRRFQSLLGLWWNFQSLRSWWGNLSQLRSNSTQFNGKVGNEIELINDLSWGDGAAMSPPGTLLMTQKGGRQTFENKRSYKEHQRTRRCTKRGCLSRKQLLPLHLENCNFLISESSTEGWGGQGQKVTWQPGSQGHGTRKPALGSRDI